jgi:hypothetical protein
MASKKECQPQATETATARQRLKEIVHVNHNE